MSHYLPRSESYGNSRGLLSYHHLPGMPPVIQPTSSIEPELLKALKESVYNIFASKLSSVAVTDPSALVNMSAVRDEISRFVNGCISQCATELNNEMSPILNLPREIFAHILRVGAFSTTDRVSIYKVCRSWANISGSYKIPVTIDGRLDRLTLNEIDDLDYALHRLLGNPPIIHLAFYIADISSPLEFGVLTRFLYRYMPTAQTVECSLGTDLPRGCTEIDLSYCFRLRTEVLTRLIIDANSFPTDMITFDHHAPNLTVVEFKHKAFFCPAFANVSTISYTFTSGYVAARDDLALIFTQFPQLRKLVFRGRTSRTSALALSSFQAPPTLERLEFFDGVDTKFLDSVDHAAVPWVEGHFFTGSQRRRLTPATLEALSAEPAVRVHVHFEPQRMANLKLITGAGRTRIYSGMYSVECVKLPLFSHVISMAITGLHNVSHEFPIMTTLPARFSETPELEEISIVVQDLRWPPIEVTCPRLAVFELVIRPDPRLPGTNIDPRRIVRFYCSACVVGRPGVLLGLPGVDLPEIGSELGFFFSDYRIGSSLVPSVLPNCI